MSRRRDAQFFSGGIATGLTFVLATATPAGRRIGAAAFKVGVRTGRFAGRFGGKIAGRVLLPLIAVEAGVETFQAARKGEVPISELISGSRFLGEVVEAATFDVLSGEDISKFIGRIGRAAVLASGAGR